MLNDLIRRSPLGSTLAAFIIGILIGLVVLGWGLLPVRYINGLPYGLRDDYKLHYVNAVADAYAADNDLAAVEQRLGGEGGFTREERIAILTKARDEARAKGDDRRVNRVQKLAEGLKLSLSPTPGSGGDTGGSWLTSLLSLLGVLLILAAVGILIYGLLRRRGEAQTASAGVRRPSYGTGGSMGGTVSMPTAPPMPRAEPSSGGAFTPVIEAEPTEAALSHFVTTYKVGDDGYDTSFSIETPNGDFLGECGVGISDVVGEGSPQKVTAFEVWLFDKNDIKTVTKVMMSDYAYNNEAIRRKLQARGDAILAQPGSNVTLETGALRVVASIADMAYGAGGTPQSFFQKVTIELAPSIKAK